MLSRRDFIKSSAAVGGLMVPNISVSKMNYEELILELTTKKGNVNIESLVADNDYWSLVRQLFKPQTKFINLENGYFSSQPASTLAQQFKQIEKVNQLNSYFMRKEQVDELQSVKTELSKFANLDESEFVICRNTTEALDTVIHGYPWQKGDEVVVNHQDYYSMLAAFHQQEKRSGIKVVYTKLPLHPKNDEEIVNAFEKSITKNTKMLLVTHLINLTGQVLPVKKIVEMAHSKGVEVMLDSAHAFAHLQFEIKDTGADYVGTSLHKWLCCPMGLGLMYIDKKHIHKIWPLFGDNEFEKDDIRKFEHWGTRPISAMATIPTAIDFHNSIGSELKYERLYYLKNYWTEKASKIKNVTVNTPFDKERSGAIANFSIEGFKPSQISERLYNEFHIFTVAIESEDVNGVRVTPHLYNTIEECQKLVEAIEKLAAE